ncbi:MAG TPA: DUF4920 domain-containing protein [Thermoanaerobaculia bacterium]|nr:DUF4920 domain-containing protein [Thermoanaerobaculia bacterium]
MKRIAIALTLLVAVAAFAKDETVKRGAPIAKDAKPVALTQVLEKPDDYAKKTIVVEGVITSVCENMGCWMQLAPAADKDGMHVTFKDYGFFVPTNSKGMKVRAEGTVELKTLSKEEADHLEGEGAKVNRDKDGTAKEVSFVAAGVELTK